MPKTKHKDNLKELIRQSRKLRNEICKWLLKFSGSFNLDHSSIKYVIAAVDLQSDLFYAPITNLSLNELKKWLKCGSPLKVIDKLREDFPVTFSPGGLLRKAIETAEYDWPELGILYLDNQCKSVYEVKIFSNGNIRHHSNNIKENVSDSVAKAIKEGKTILKTTATALLLQRRQIEFDNGIIKPSRLVSMALVGVVFANNVNDMRSSIKYLSYFVNTCAFASYAIISERERYFERAIHQCHHGEMLKSGHFKEIKKQVKILNYLKRNGCWGLPSIIDYDKEPRDKKQTKDQSWYFMRRFLPPSLKELLTSVPGLACYEVRAIIHRVISHLHDSFWRIKAKNKKTKKNEAINIVRLPLYLAKKKTEDLSKRFRKCMQKIQKLKPVDTKRGLALKTLSSLGKAQSFSEQFIEKYWNIQAYFTERGRNNEEILEPRYIASKLKRLVTQCDNITQVKIKKDGYIHGDAHFENILVDASIPEDSVVVSIDPDPNLFLSKEDRKEYKESCNIDDNVIDSEVALLFHDRTYDYARLLLSAWLLYTLASVDGISMKRNKTNKSIWRFSLERGKIIEENSIRGGVTGAVINAVTSIPQDVILYHNTAKDMIVESFLKELPQRYLNHNKGNDDVQIDRLMIVRLWALTIRHGLSICSLMYPEKASGACSLYVITASLFLKGEETVKNVLKEKYTDNAHELAHTLFISRFQENISK